MKILYNGFVKKNIIITGKSNLISTSNTKNKITKIKNRIEKGLRILLKGSNPHSNAENFWALTSIEKEIK